MEPEKKSSGALIGLIVIVVVLIIGGLYLWKSNIIETNTPGTYSTETMEKDTETTESTQTSTETTQTSNTATSIEADLNSMDMEGLDSGI